MPLLQLNPREGDAAGLEETAGSGSGLCDLAAWEEAEWKLRWPKAVPESNMGSLSRDFLTWSDSPVRELSSILRSFPWIRIPSAGSRSPSAQRGRGNRERGEVRSWRRGKPSNPISEPHLHTQLEAMAHRIAREPLKDNFSSDYLEHDYFLGFIISSNY